MMVAMREMSEAEWIAFVRAGTRTGKLAIVLPSGRPTVTAVWFLYEDDGVVRFNTMGTSAKARALRADPRASLLVDLEEPPYAFVRIDGTVRLVDDDPELLLRTATEIGGRYMGADRAEEYGRRNAVEGEVVVELSPTKVVAFDDVSG